MALVRIITEAAFKKLSSELQAEYSKTDDGYELDATGFPDGEADAALRKAKDNAAAEAKEAKKALAIAQGKLDEIEVKKATASGDVDAINAGWQKKLDTQADEHTTALNAKDAFISKSLVDNVASGLAADLTNTPAMAKVLLPHIKARLVSDLTGDEPVTKVKDADGKVSAATVADLRKEFVDNKDFSGIVSGTKASGGGAPVTKVGGGAPVTSTNSSDIVDLSKLGSKELAAHLAARKEAAET